MSFFSFFFFFVSTSISRGAAFCSSAAKFLFWRDLRARACNLCSHLCVPRARVSSPSVTDGIMFCVSTCAYTVNERIGRKGKQEGERRGRHEARGGGRGEGGGREGGRGGGEPVTSNYTARFIIYRRQFLLPPRRCIRPTIEG